MKRSWRRARTMPLRQCCPATTSGLSPCSEPTREFFPSVVIDLNRAADSNVHSTRVSKPYLEAMNNVSLRHSHEAGGSLPAKLHFARLKYARETVLTTRFWLWRYVQTAYALGIADRAHLTRVIRAEHP